MLQSGDHANSASLLGQTAVALSYSLSAYLLRRENPLFALAELPALTASLMLTVVLAGLSTLAVGLTLLSWLGRLRAFLQGARLAQAFTAELRRRGLLPAAVVRT